ncbi:MAG: septum formation initiator family protein [Candidatus Binataceae bacterium]
MKKFDHAVYYSAMSKLSWLVGRKWPSLILAMVVLALALNCLIAPRGLRDLLVLRTHRVQSERDRRELRTEQAALETEVRKLRSDDRYLQSLIRREWGFARQDELVYRFKSESQPSVP